MYNELHESLGSEPTKNLFYYFKNDGLISFEKKLVAGIILHKRRYDSDVLRSEKEKIIKQIQERIKESVPSSEREDKHKREEKKEIIFAAIGSLAIPFFYVLVDVFNSRPINFTDSQLIGCFVVMLLFVVKVMFYRVKLNMRSREDAESLRINKEKLALIEKEWRF
ncbi:MAG: hypothetical protein JXA53_04540 [Bacteroidales bacterium]|nr:hypothetical protein [Bacteroidales bacterium]